MGARGGRRGAGGGAGRSGTEGDERVPRGLQTPTTLMLKEATAANYNRRFRGPPLSSDSSPLPPPSGAAEMVPLTNVTNGLDKV